jgi:septal ring factor EnvC (AmiA/AmiB activator)
MDWTIDRLQELRSEFAEGERQLNDTERRREQLRDQLLRIEGAIRVLEEQLAAAPVFAPSEPVPAPG